MAMTVIAYSPIFGMFNYSLNKSSNGATYLKFMVYSNRLYYRRMIKMIDLKFTIIIQIKDNLRRVAGVATYVAGVGTFACVYIHVYL